MIFNILYSIYFHTIKFAVLCYSTFMLTVNYIFCIFMPQSVKKEVGFLWGKYWGKLTLLFSFVKVKVEYPAKPLDYTKNYVFAGNHASSFDIYLMYSLVPIKFFWIAKKSLLYIPVLNLAMWLQGHIFVERDDSAKAAGSLKKAVENIRKGDYSIGIFPEGTRSQNGKLLPFKKGAFALARLCGLDIVPVVIRNANKVAPPKKLFNPRHEIIVKFLEPIDGKDKKAEENLRQIFERELAENGN